MQIAGTSYMTLKAGIERDDQDMPHLEFWVAQKGGDLIKKVRLNVQETVATFLKLREALTDEDGNMLLALLDQEDV